MGPTVLIIGIGIGRALAALLPGRARHTAACLALLAASLLLPRPGNAQEISTADSAAVVLETARDFEEEGRADLAEALYQYLLSRFPDTPAAQAVRSRFADEGGSERVQLDGSGRVELLVWSTVYGGWLGIAIPEMAGADDPEAFGLGLLLGAPAGFLGGRWYDSGRTVTEGHARAVTLGGSWGTWQGLGWAQVFELGSDCFRTFEGQRICEDGPSLEATFASMVAGGLLGIGTGAYLANRTAITAGTSTLANVGALWGSGYGVAAGLMFGSSDEDALLTLALAGGNLGLASMALLGPGWDVSRERARLISIAGVVGLLGGLGFDLLLQPRSTEVATLIPTVTSTAGLVVGAYATRGMDRGTGSSSRAKAGAIRGGAEIRDAALARWRDGRLELSVPRPTVTLREPPAAREWTMGANEGGVDRWREAQRLRRLALELRLFSARF